MIDDVMKEDMLELRDVLSQWRAWLIINEEPFQPDDVVRCLEEAVELVKELSKKLVIPL